MNDEINEILYKINNYPEKLYCLNVYVKHLLSNYITNLQKENKHLKLLKERYQLEKEYYKSRNKKAIEYIRSLEEDTIDFDGEVIIGEIGYHCKDKLLNILNGGDEDE